MRRPMHADGRNVRGCSLICDDCGDQLELRAHGEGVRGAHGGPAGRALVVALQVIARRLGWSLWCDGATGQVIHHSCPRCTAKLQQQRNHQRSP